MAMVSVKAFIPPVLMVFGILAGCAGVAPVKESKPGADVVESTEQAEQGRNVSASDDGGAFLPQQAYDDQRNKIPYIPAPNPYMEKAEPVPPSARAAFAEAQEFLAQGDLRMARKGFRAMTKEFPALSGPWVKLARIAEQREQPENARGAYRKAVKVNPSNVNAYLEQAMFERRQGAFDNAREAYLAALKLWHDFPEAHLNLGILYDLYMNRPEGAQAHYEAYDFLTGGSDPKMADWLIEIRRRTGIETSFIDNPPPKPELPAEQAVEGESVSAETTSGDSAETEEQG